ncbi:MAG: hypothetical protein ACLFRG_15565 [Desulfococcaceae bacterium]
MCIPKIISSILDEEKTPAVVRLLELIQKRSERIEELEDEMWQYCHVHATRPAIWERLREIGCDVSPGEISRILPEGEDAFSVDGPEVRPDGNAATLSRA